MMAFGVAYVAAMVGLLLYANRNDSPFAAILFLLLAAPFLIVLAAG